MFPGKAACPFLPLSVLTSPVRVEAQPCAPARSGVSRTWIYLVGFFFSLLKRVRVSPVFPPLLPCVHGAAFGEAFLVQSLPRGDGRRGCPMAARSAARHPS